MADIVYNPNYNYYAPKLFPHPFNPTKAKDLVENLLANTDVNINVKFLSVDKPVTYEDLLDVHDESYLSGLNSAYISDAIDFPGILKFCPQNYIESCLLTPMRWQVAGTLQGTKKALENNSCTINLGGGYHHAKKSKGHGGCLFADIPLAIKKYCQNMRVAIIDLDAHQGDGLVEYAENNDKIYVFDMFNKNEFPYTFNKLIAKYEMDDINNKIVYHGFDGGHIEAKLFGISNINIFNYTINMSSYNYMNVLDTVVNRQINDDTYMNVLRDSLDRFIDIVKPDIVYYNMGSDPYINDPWGCMGLSKFGIIQRDEFVYDRVRKKRNIPMVITLSGGYAKDNVQLICDSILNLLKK